MSKIMNLHLQTTSFPPIQKVNKVLYLLIILNFFALPLWSTTYYVRSLLACQNGCDGLSWNTAFSDLQEAIDATSDGDEIWVAQGTYSPGNDESSSFIILGKDIRIYGGFYGWFETSLSERPGHLYPSILSGLQGANHSVVTIFSAPSTFVLDGFHITGGKANGSGSLGTESVCGGGIYNQGSVNNPSQPIIRNCKFYDNNADYGGAIFNNGFTGKAKLYLVNCTFQYNSANQGGALFNYGGGVIITGDPYADAVIYNCTFSSNSASEGQSMYNQQSEYIDCYNSIFWEPGAILDNTQEGTTLNHCNIWGGWSGFGGNNLSTDPLFLDEFNGDFRLHAISPLIDAGTGSGSSLTNGGDIDGQIRFEDNPNIPGVSSIDIGAHEFHNNALHFDGVDDYVNIPNSNSLDIPGNKITLEAWIKLEQLPNEIPNNFMSIYDSDIDAYVLYLDKGNDELRFKVTDQSGVATRPGIPSSMLIKNEWMHIAGVYNGDQGKAMIYLNGNLVDTHNDAGSSSVKNGQAAKIGVQAGINTFFKGAIDEVIIWQTALDFTPTQDGGLNGPPNHQSSHLIAYWGFNQGFSGGGALLNNFYHDAEDFSANNNQGSLVGFNYEVNSSNYVDGTTYTSNTVLPVEWMNFEAEAINQKDVLINWSTASEQNNLGFEIEYLVNPDLEESNWSWEKAGFVHGVGNSFSEQFYSFKHQPNTSGEIYYRLKQIDIDQNFEYSEVRVVDFNKDLSIKIFPNPTAEQLEIRVNQENLTKFKISLKDANGRLVDFIRGETNQGLISEKIDMSKYLNGIYYLIIEGPKTPIIEKIIKI